MKRATSPKRSPTAERAALKQREPPPFVEPMLAKLVRALPEGPGWSYEVKFDGYRIEAIKNGGQVRLFSRRGNDFTKRFAKVGAKTPWVRGRGRALGMGGPGLRAEKSPAGAGDVGLAPPLARLRAPERVRAGGRAW